MSNLNRGIMKFDGADRPVVVGVFSVIMISAIAALIIWALQIAYAVD